MPVPLLVGVALGAIAASPAPTSGECARGPTAILCIYRSGLPSAGIVSSCRDERTCRVGYYYGQPSDAVWFAAPPGLSAFPRPEVTWLTATLGQVRFDCGRSCSWSYFFEARRRRLSDPRPRVVAVDSRRSLLATIEDRALVVRQVFSWREVARLERDWAPAEWPGDVISNLHFDPDGRLSFTWLQGRDRVPVSERVSIPSVPRPP